MARLGLRDSDVQNLTFSNILWKECRISLVQTKTKRALDLPITEEIGNAIIEYLKYGRPKHIVSDYIFVRHSAPYDKCNNYYHIMRKYLQRAGISFDSERNTGYTLYDTRLLPECWSAMYHYRLLRKFLDIPLQIQPKNIYKWTLKDCVNVH